MLGGLEGDLGGLMDAGWLRRGQGGVMDAGWRSREQSTYLACHKDQPVHQL